MRRPVEPLPTGHGCGADHLHGGVPSDDLVPTRQRQSSRHRRRLFRLQAWTKWCGPQRYRTPPHPEHPVGERGCDADAGIGHARSDDRDSSSGRGDTCSLRKVRERPRCPCTDQPEPGRLSDRHHGAGLHAAGRALRCPRRLRLRYSVDKARPPGDTDGRRARRGVVDVALWARTTG